VSVKNKNILDIGCGGGILTESLTQLGAYSTGIDMNKSLIEIAKLHQLETGLTIEYRHQSAEAIAAELPENYDVITCMEMLEHVPDPAAIVKACAKLVKPGGHVFFSTLNRNPKSYLMAILGAEYVLKLLPKNTHDFSKFIKPSELSSWLREAGLSIKEMRGIAYNPFTKQFKLTNDISVNYICYARKE